MVDAPERIWLQDADDAEHQCEGRLWCEDKVWPENEHQHEPTQYLRADIAASQLAEVRAKLDLANDTIEMNRAAAEAERDRLAAENEALVEAAKKLRVAAQNQGVSDANKISWLKANAAQGVEAIDDGLEILVNLTDSISKHGNYSPEATRTFIDQAGQDFRRARAALDTAKGAENDMVKMTLISERLKQRIEGWGPTTAIAKRNRARLIAKALQADFETMTPAELDAWIDNLPLPEFIALVEVHGEFSRKGGRL